MVDNHERVAIVTGGGSGIGAATAAALRTDGWEVVICGRREAALARTAADSGAVPVVADVTDPAGIDLVVEETLRRYGRIDAVVFNAGIVRAGALGALSDEDWDEMVATNLTSPFRLARATLPHVIATNGSFVAVASAAALRATAGIAGYDATKAGLTMLMQSVAVDYGPSGVRANVVCPGWTRTEMADAEMTEMGESIGTSMETAYQLASAFTPARRPGDAMEIGRVIAWLLSPAASYINAAVLPVDGGLVAVEPGQIGFDERLTVNLANTADRSA